MEKKTIKIPFNTESVDTDDYTIDFVMSTNDVDREGDIVEQNWDLQSYMENPVVLNSHQYDDVTETIGKVTELTQKQNSLEGKVKFAVEENPKAETIFELYKGGFLNAVSVGFRELEDGVNELMELSSVAVPANAMATAKSKGIDIEPLEKDLDEKIKETLSVEKIIEEARTPDYEDTETASWGDVDKTMEAFLSAYPEDTEDINSVDDMNAELKNWIANKTLLGDPNADTFSELAFFPVVNPDTNNLNKGALVAVRSGRGQQADIPQSTYNSAYNKAGNLLEEEFDVDTDEESKSITKEGRVLSSANRKKVEKAISALNDTKNALEALLEASEKDKDEEETKDEEPEEEEELVEETDADLVTEALNEIHQKLDEENADRKAHKVIRNVKNEILEE